MTHLEIISETVPQVKYGTWGPPPRGWCSRPFLLQFCFGISALWVRKGLFQFILEPAPQTGMREIFLLLFLLLFYVFGILVNSPDLEHIASNHMNKHLIKKK